MNRTVNKFLDRSYPGGERTKFQSAVLRRDTNISQIQIIWGLLWAL